MRVSPRRCRRGTRGELLEVLASDMLPSGVRDRRVKAFPGARPVWFVFEMGYPSGNTPIVLQFPPFGQWNKICIC